MKKWIKEMWEDYIQFLLMYVAIVAPGALLWLYVIVPAIIKADFGG